MQRLGEEWDSHLEVKDPEIKSAQDPKLVLSSASVCT